MPLGSTALARAELPPDEGAPIGGFRATHRKPYARPGCGAPTLPDGGQPATAR
ncbi:hypothetical protein [Paractinoplanes toevensis]|uniref:hypothetical protein n=1 Tax=Paractinoplanes toevensis TaxID=571911 RepID=UPI001BB4198F|nr:hypothetical protein [Actinoplanes toevensis]